MQLTLQGQEVDINSFLPKRVQEYLSYSLDYIHKYSDMKEWESHGVTKNDKYLRYQFWRILDDCVYRDVNVQISKVYQGICSRQTFYHIMKNPVRCGFIFSKPVDHDLEAEIYLDQAKKEMLEILALPNIDHKGNPIGAVLTAKIKIYARLEDRVHGQTVQRIEQKTLTKSVKDEFDDPKSVKELENQLKMIEKKKDEVIDV